MKDKLPILRPVTYYFDQEPTSAAMTLFDLLSNDERIIVASDVGEGVIYTWNQSLTFQCWRPIIRMGGEQKWVEVAIRVASDTPENFQEAREYALRWKRE